MKGITILDLRTMNLMEALQDETIFILKDRRQKRAHYPDEMELRCSCVQLRTMSSQDLRDMVDNIDEYQAIKLEL